MRGMDKHFIEPVKRLRIERGNILKDAKLTGRSGVDAFRLNKRYAIFLVGVVEGHLPVNGQDAYLQIVERLGASVEKYKPDGCHAEVSGFAGLATIIFAIGS